MAPSQNGISSKGPTSGSGGTVVVFGATGHTGRFVTAELARRGFTPRLAGRDAGRLQAAADAHGSAEVHVASIDNPASLDRALRSAAAVINCAGPFLDTAAPLVEAALRARIHYLDVTAEQPSALATFEHFADAARRAGVVVMPAMAFYGGLGDLLATAAMAEWSDADEIIVAIALDSWKPTAGTRLTGRRNTARRLVVAGAGLEPLPDPPPTRAWHFPAPFGSQEVVGLPFTEIITISRHLKVGEIGSYMNLAPLTDLRNPDTPAPSASDASGRSDQRFLVEVVVRRAGAERRVVARGRDIYAITAPLVVEATARILAGRAGGPGVLAAGAAFDAPDFLDAIGPGHLTVEYVPAAPSLTPG